MLYGIISDIHANLEAFDVVLNKLYRVDKIICLGDIVGYGPNPNECVKKVREMNIPSAAGNHDKAVTGDMEITWFNYNARSAIEYTQREIKGENLDFLKGLTEIHEEDDFQYVHGSLRSPLREYITNIFEAVPTLERMTKKICFVGHSHIPLFIAQKDDGNFDGRILMDEEEVVTDEYSKIVINVGAIGQPRDGDPRASYGLYDTETKIFSLHRVEYNIEMVQEKMKTAGLPQPLIERLSFGR